MRTELRDYLFNKGILVSCDGTQDGSDPFYTLFVLRSLYLVQIDAGGELAVPELVEYVGHVLGKNVPEPFYRGFPDTVRWLSPSQRLFDQLFHYCKTYGLGLFEEAGHSIFEGQGKRSPFREDTELRHFRILSEEEAWVPLVRDGEALLASSRPLSAENFALLSQLVWEGRLPVERCGSKNTAVRLLLDLRDLRFAKFLQLSDVMKLLSELQYRVYKSEDLRRLSLRNADRVFLRQVIDRLILDGKCDAKVCSEKRALWCGLLHHIHYRPVNEEAAAFVKAMRNKEIRSAWSDLDRALATGDIPGAIEIVRREKGDGALLRNIDYLLSRCRDAEQRRTVLDALPAGNAVLLLQLYFHYRNFIPHDQELGITNGERWFRFARFEKLRTHAETAEEALRRKTHLPPELIAETSARIEALLRQTLRGRLGKTWIDPALPKIAIPLQEATSQGGYGVLPKGSRLPLPEGKKLRAFTYWEKVDDIDLSAIGMTEDGWQIEFSWRNMYDESGKELVYSGDQTSGYHGGSEYFDLDIDAFAAAHPDLQYLIFCDNVYSDRTFAQCLCRAGYMLRHEQDSGQVFEPKTVKSSFTVNCDSTFAFLFAIDLARREFVWLNAARASSLHVAGLSDLAFLWPYLDAALQLDLRDLFTMMASELTDDPAKADCVLSDREDLTLRPDARQIRSCDVAQVLGLLSGR